METYEKVLEDNNANRLCIKLNFRKNREILKTVSTFALIDKADILFDFFILICINYLIIIIGS